MKLPLAIAHWLTRHSISDRGTVSTILDVHSVTQFTHFMYKKKEPGETEPIVGAAVLPAVSTEVSDASSVLTKSKKENWRWDEGILLGCPAT